jgi:FAD synthetase
MSKTAGIVVIGNEILSARTRDENAAYFLRELRALGVSVRRVSIIPDELNSIRDEIRSSSEGYDYVFTSGGVGPTHDDVTIAGVAAAFERPICRSTELEKTLRGYYQENLTDAMLRMAEVPEGASLLRHNRMWFPVIAVENVYIFPGVPEILASKFERIKEMFRESPFLTVDVFLDVEEGYVADALSEVLERFPSLLLGSYPTFNNPAYKVKLTLESKDQPYLERARECLFERLEARSIVPIELRVVSDE